MNEASSRAIKQFDKITSTTQLLPNELIIEEVIGLFTVRDVHDGLTLLTILFYCIIGVTLVRPVMMTNGGLVKAGQLQQLTLFVLVKQL